MSSTTEARPIKGLTGKPKQGEDLHAPERKHHPCENGSVPKNVADERPDDADATERRQHEGEKRRSTVTCSRVTTCDCSGHR